MSENGNDKRLIEDYLPIEAISAEASREKSVRKGHISTLHLWWARRPLVACRAAVYGALVPASRFVPENGTDEKKKSLGRANSARFVKSLCRYPSDSKPEEKATIGRAIQEAQRHILIAHADRLTAELADWKAARSGKPGWVDEFKWAGERVVVEDIVAGRAPRPRVLDMFAGGGAIPLEALRLGCEAYALDLNPVAHIIQLCTLVYPQKYGKPDPTARGMTGPKNAKGETTWGGLADEVRYWGNWVLKKVKAEIGDLYPLIPDPAHKGKRPPIELDRDTGEWVISRKGAKTPSKNDDPFAPPQGVMDFAEDAQLRLSPQSPIQNRKSKTDLPPGYLMPVAYLWTRTVKCKNPACGAIVPLVKQTWLCKKEGRYVAMKMVADRGTGVPPVNHGQDAHATGKKVRFEVVEARTEKGLGFDPSAFSKAGNAACPFCGAVADSDYVKAEGCAGRMSEQLMAIVCTRPGARGKVYLAVSDLPDAAPDDVAIEKRIGVLCARTGITVPDEPIEINPRSMDVDRIGIAQWSDLFSSRQMCCLLNIVNTVHAAASCMSASHHTDAVVTALATYLGTALDREAEDSSVLCRWNPTAEKMQGTFGRQSLPMVWDYCEINPFGGSVGDWTSLVDLQVNAIDGAMSHIGLPAHVTRGSALALPWNDACLDAVITDPPYYDNVSYSNLSDFFFMWLKRSVGRFYQDHFAGNATPKRNEAIAAFYRHNGDRDASRAFYERMMRDSFLEGYRVLKPQGNLVLVYAHKTTLGWSTLVDALRSTGFVVSEAWPLDTEMKTRLVAMDTAALASSIFLVARKRDATSKVGNYETDVVPELGSIVRERVETLWEMGISGADLVIACVGAGLRAFTKYARVEFANGEEVPAERFLMEVETVVLEAILGKLSKTVARASRPYGASGQNHGQDARATTSLSGLDPATRFYVLWRYTYGGAELDAGEAIIFANGTHVELDGQHSLTAGAHALLEKKKGKYRLLDFTERGEHCGTGVPPVDRGTEHGQDARATIDALHRLLWLVEHKPPKIPDFLNEAKPNVEQLRLVAQALAGPALKGGELADVSPTAEQSALGKLLANWNAVMVGKAAIADKRAGQEQLF